MAKVLADAELIVAERPARSRDTAMSRARFDRGGLGLFARFRAARQRAALRAPEAQASSEPRDRRPFLIRNR
jgi:hypothetical protein